MPLPPPGNHGYRHGPAWVLQAIARGETVAADQYYMRTHARPETGNERYERGNRTLFLGVGARNRQSVMVRLYAIR